METSSVLKERRPLPIVDLTDLIGKPYQDGGRGPHAYDCYGLAIEVCRRYGIMLPQYIISADDVALINGIATLHQGWIKCDPNGTIPCVMALRFDSRYINHVGVYLGKGRFIHIAKDIRVHISRIDHPLWKDNIAGYYLPEKGG